MKFFLVDDDPYVPDDWCDPYDHEYCDTCVDDEGYPCEAVYLPEGYKTWYNGDHTAVSMRFRCSSCGNEWDERCD